MAEGETVQRHSLFLRISHWIDFIVPFMLIITGLEISGLYGNTFAFFNNVHNLHIYIGGFWLAWVVFHVYYLIVAGEFKHFIPNMWGVKYIWAEAKAWLGRGPKPEEPVTYDAEKKKYVRKVDPGSWIDFWIFALLTLVLGVTGIMMGFPEFTRKVGFGFLFDLFGGVGAWFGVNNALVFARIVHRFSLYLFIMLLIIHIYSMAILGYLKPMITGKQVLKAHQLKKE